MQRPTSVTVFAVLNIIFAVLGILGLAMTLVMALKMPNMPNPTLEIAREQPVYGAWLYGSMVLGGIFAVVLIVSAIGMLRLKAWARTTVVFLSIANLVLAILGGFLNYIYLFQPLLEKAAQTQGPEKAGMIGGAYGGLFGGCFSLVYYALLLFFMTRPKVVAAFAGSSASPELPPV